MKSKHLRDRANLFTLLLCCLLNTCKHITSSSSNSSSHALRQKSFLQYFFQVSYTLWSEVSKIKFQHFILRPLSCYACLIVEKFWSQILPSYNFPPYHWVWHNKYAPRATCSIIWRYLTFSLKSFLQAEHSHYLKYFLH